MYRFPVALKKVEEEAGGLFAVNHLVDALVEMSGRGLAEEAEQGIEPLLFIALQVDGENVAAKQERVADFEELYLLARPVIGRGFDSLFVYQQRVETGDAVELEADECLCPGVGVGEESLLLSVGEGMGEAKITMVHLALVFEKEEVLCVGEVLGVDLLPEYSFCVLCFLSIFVVDCKFQIMRTIM